ncbi:hypothetical protein YSY43_12800 [Paenibacillus sp. YSY-4.3]
MKRNIIMLSLFALIIIILFISLLRTNNDGKTRIEDSIVNDFNSHRSLFDNIANKVLLNDEDISYELDSNINSDLDLSKLFSMGYHSIHSADKSFVYFIKDSNFGFSQGLVFSKEGGQPVSPYLTSLQELDNHWYLYKMK